MSDSYIVLYKFSAVTPGLNTRLRVVATAQRGSFEVYGGDLSPSPATVRGLRNGECVLLNTCPVVISAPNDEGIRAFKQARSLW